MPSALIKSLLIYSLLVTAACSTSVDDDLDTTTTTKSLKCESPDYGEGIVGGTKVLKNDNPMTSSTVLIVNISATKSVSVCTGTLLNETTVLTAAHCQASAGGTSVVAFTNSVACLSSGNFAVVSKTIPHPDYAKTPALYRSAYDIALMKIDAKIPAGFKAQALPGRNEQIKDEDNLTMLGFGITKDGANDEGVLRVTSGKASRIQSEIYVKLADTTFSVPNTIAFDQKSNGVCNGDSGGPLFVANKEATPVLVGVTSIGVDTRTTSSGDVRPCRGVALFTDIRTHLDWIEKEMQ